MKFCTNNNNFCCIYCSYAGKSMVRRRATLNRIAVSFATERILVVCFVYLAMVLIVCAHGEDSG